MLRNVVTKTLSRQDAKNAKKILFFFELGGLCAFARDTVFYDLFFIQKFQKSLARNLAVAKRA